ncbi:13376_t:CDS:2, partial [Acaulospora colombiana]
MTIPELRQAKIYLSSTYLVRNMVEGKYEIDAIQLTNKAGVIVERVMIKAQINGSAQPGPLISFSTHLVQKLDLAIPIWDLRMIPILVVTFTPCLQSHDLTSLLAQNVTYHRWPLAGSVEEVVRVLVIAGRDLGYD